MVEVSPLIFCLAAGVGASAIFCMSHYGMNYTWPDLADRITERLPPGVKMTAGLVGVRGREKAAGAAHLISDRARRAALAQIHAHSRPG